mmetsp:Transcript_7230/g.16591  ORF Transcript_7230/g.16591 Transcript_7230/m.16591 type:complete len:249 (-) Transcript_7230:44-790(-)
MSESARPMRAAVAAAAAISLLVLGLVDLSRPRGDRAGSEVALEESYMYGAPGNRGRAPGVRAIEHSFERFYQKGLHGVDETRVDLPLQHFSVTESGVRLRPAGGAKPTSVLLTNIERETAKEEQSDPGALLRLRALGGHVTHKIQGIMGSIERKLDTASAPRLARAAKAAAEKAKREHLTPSHDAWDKAFEGKVAALDRAIAQHGGVKPLYRKRSWGDKDPSVREQVDYENALRGALGSKPKALPGVY